MLNEKLLKQIEELVYKHGGNDVDLDLVIEMTNQTEEKRWTIADIEEDMKNGDMIDLPMCKIRNTKNGCFGCEFLSNEGFCITKTN